MLEYSPDILHFACHGSPEAELVLASDEAHAAPVPASALASMFGVLKDNLALVVCNACFTSEHADAVRHAAGVAIGMRTRIEDRVAIAFASSLYGALAYGRSVQVAFELARSTVEALDAEQRHTPQLMVQDGIDASAMCLCSLEPSGTAAPRATP